MNRIAQHHRFDLACSCHPAGVEELGKLPTNSMDGRCKSDQDRGVCQVGDKERDDGGEGCEPERYAKQTTIGQIDDDVIAQMLAGELFDPGERQHCMILLDSLLFHFYLMSEYFPEKLLL